MVYGVYGWDDNSPVRVFDTIDFSYYNSFVTRFPDNARIADTTEDYSSVINKDIIIIEFNEQAFSPDAAGFIFAENVMKYIDGNNLLSEGAK